MKDLEKLISEERELVGRCKQNDRQAQKQLFDRYKNNMFTLCVRMVNDHDLASDILQEAFIEIFKHLDSFQHKSTLGAWIKTIVIRKAIKSNRRHTFFQSMDESHEDHVWYWPENLTGEVLAKAIGKLPDSARSIFVLIEVEGYKHREVADMLGISEGTSKSQLHHAKGLLRETLKDFRYED